MFLDRNARDRRSCVGRLTIMSWSEVGRIVFLGFSGSSGFIFVNLVFSAILWSRIVGNNEN